MRRDFRKIDGGKRRGRKDEVNWTTIGVVALIAVVAGTAIGIELADNEQRAAEGPAEARAVDETPVDARVGPGEDEGAPYTGRPTHIFSFCHVGGGENCVVDGDTIWLEGEKIRLLDIDAPETHDYRCASEKALGDAATRRLQVLLNSGVVTTRATGDRDRDVYGRKLRSVYVDGVNVSDRLIAEGLARPYAGGRRSWC